MQGNLHSVPMPVRVPSFDVLVIYSICQQQNIVTWSPPALIILPRHVYCGVSVCRSQSRTVVSPLPVARYSPSGLNDAHSTASPWPSSVDEQRVTARTRNIAWGRYTIARETSVDFSPDLNTSCASECDISTSLTKNEYGVYSPYNGGIINISARFGIMQIYYIHSAAAGSG